MVPDREPYDQDDNTEDQEDEDAEQQESAGGAEAADVDVALSEEGISELLTAAILHGLSASDEGLLAVHQTSFKGPLPPPAVMSDYDAVVQNGAERIMSMAEKAMAMSEKGQDAIIADRREDRRAERRGQNHALVFVLAVLAVGAVGMVRPTEHRAGVALPG